MDVVAAIVVCAACLAGVLLSLITLPGAWFMLLAAGVCQWWRGDLFSWWTLGICLGLAVLGEVLEVVLSAAGARKSGATRSGAFGAVVGSLAGALGGAPVVFPLGAVLGAVLGAGAGAMAVELLFNERPAGEAATAARGAMKGRAVATGVKALLSLAIGMTLAVAAVWP